MRVELPLLLAGCRVERDYAVEGRAEVDGVVDEERCCRPDGHRLVAAPVGDVARVKLPRLFELADVARRNLVFRREFLGLKVAVERVPVGALHPLVRSGTGRLRNRLRSGALALGRGALRLILALRLARVLLPWLCLCGILPRRRAVDIVLRGLPAVRQSGLRLCSIRCGERGRGRSTEQGCADDRKKKTAAHDSTSLRIASLAICSSLGSKKARMHQPISAATMAPSSQLASRK